MNKGDLKKLLCDKVDYAVYNGLDYSGRNVIKITSGSDRATIHLKDGSKFVFSFHIEKPRAKQDSDDELELI